MKLFFAYLRTKWRVIAVFFLFACLYAAVLVLYSLPLAAALYPGLLCLLLGSIFLMAGFANAKRRHDAVSRIADMATLLPNQLPEAETVLEEDYRRLLRLLQEEATQRKTVEAERFNDLTDYYTAWAHQIKTPIAAMKLTLQNEDSALSRRLNSDLLRIEQYVQMVLTYLRLDSDITDYVFRECPLDDILRPCLRKFAPEFIERKLQLSYLPTEQTVLTDEKWLSFVIEQLLSNALKYTMTGGIRIEVEDSTLRIADTGIGITPEDLPRIFEKGYTGKNGRRDRTASGIGLYLCRRICTNLGIELRAESTLGEGTAITLVLQK